MDRKELLKKIGQERGSSVLAYFTSDRPGPIGAKIGMDIIPIFSGQLRAMGKQEKIDLVLYSTGGDTMVPWRLVSMIREYCDKLAVLVPYKAHSAATMIALGADEIVMSDLSELSPIDPSTANVFNPPQPGSPQGRIPISVEDVVAYFDLAKNKFGISSDASLEQIFSQFGKANPQIHPLALGNVNRIHNLIRLLARQLLLSHKEPMAEAEVDKVVGYFTEKLYSHQYFIGRKEARESLGLNSVMYAKSGLADVMTEIYESFKEEMKIGEQWNQEMELGAGMSQGEKDYTIAYVESEKQSQHFDLHVEFRRQQVPVQQQTPQGPMQVQQEKVVWRVVRQGWE
ncbi:MAG: hypothetical protein U1C49_00120 [Candidatus Andersenbacteria bacterium]|nr:hypothetical protein [bacterium]MDZ4225230.1 hypothetical protein [Candidatus Andersenbacteria bacterium]